MRAHTLVLFALTALAATAIQAEVQRISAVPAQQQVAVGGVATVTIVYDSDDSTVAGVAARLHYDSSKLTLESAELLFSNGLMGHQEQPDSGSSYFDQFDDGDPATDLRYVGAWSDLYAKWPGESAVLPLPLLRLQFRVRSGFESTTLALTGDHCASCRLFTLSATILADPGGLLAGPTATPDPALNATPTAVASATPTPTTTVTPALDVPEPLGPELPQPGQTVTGIPTLSGVGTLLLIVALAGCAVGVLFKNRR